ncbi:Piso0_005253 [Millerozyma farinosa CBS 7064]|uniref:Piso0_005253 protein n=1 Tax=Pichia sorbitophila (strain ATCC MYA-4447 / BCRC 22081 / CBS 7064 / NBRC 10061 / NRRL Y-12695) TaxID=559304 RepID=G8Y1P0_PICSO|nr:Piso0_005253 [Millerozyma farinosa CBS 7064]
MSLAAAKIGAREHGCTSQGKSFCKEDRIKPVVNEEATSSGGYEGHRRCTFALSAPRQRDSRDGLFYAGMIHAYADRRAPFF